MRDAYSYRAKLLKVLDGDTIKVSVRLIRVPRVRNRDLGLHLYVEDGYVCTHITVRLYGIDAAKVTTPEGVAAREWLLENLSEEFTLHTLRDRTEKYGRWLGVVWHDRARGASLNERMVEAGRARPWDGTGERPLGVHSD